MTKPLTTHAVISMACASLDKAAEAKDNDTMISSAKLCLEDAVQNYHDGNFLAADSRALKSLAYTAGIESWDYIMASHSIEARNTD